MMPASPNPRTIKFLSAGIAFAINSTAFGPLHPVFCCSYGECIIGKHEVTRTDRHISGGGQIAKAERCHFEAFKQAGQLTTVDPVLPLWSEAIAGSKLAFRLLSALLYVTVSQINAGCAPLTFGGC